MSGATAGSDWWDRRADDEDADERPVPDAPLDGRTTQPMPRIDPTGTESPIDSRTTQPSRRIDRTESEVSLSAGPRSSSPDTRRVQAPAWFLHAQKMAAEQRRTAEQGELDDGAGAAALDADASAGPLVADDEDLSPPGGWSIGPSKGAIDPTAVRHDLDDAATPTDRSPVSAADAADRPQLLDPTVAASYREPTPPPDVVAGVIGLVGGALLAIGSFLTWGRSTGTIEATVTGLTGSNGWGTLTCGMVVAFGAALVLTGRRNGLVGGAMLVAALAAVYFCGFSAVDILRTGDELPDILVGAGIDRDVAGAATLELTSGFAVVAVGAGAALFAATIAFARRV